MTRAEREIYDPNGRYRRGDADRYPALSTHHDGQWASLNNKDVVTLLRRLLADVQAAWWQRSNSRDFYGLLILRKLLAERSNDFEPLQRKGSTVAGWTLFCEMVDREG